MQESFCLVFSPLFIRNNGCSHSSDKYHHVPLSNRLIWDTNYHTFYFLPPPDRIDLKIFATKMVKSFIVFIALTAGEGFDWFEMIFLILKGLIRKFPNICNKRQSSWWNGTGNMVNVCYDCITTSSPCVGEIDIRISHNIVLTSSTNINNDRTRAGQTLGYTATELSKTDTI